MQPEKLGPYHISETLGRGGMGAVYLGTHEETGEIVAVKVLLATLEEDEELRSRFELEIDTLKHLRHTNIVRLYGFGAESGLLYYVMEFVKGQSLHQELKKHRMFEWYEVAKIGLEMSLALKHAHDRGITHRDIKPANIMLEESGLIKLSDFGIAQYFGSQHLTEVNSVVGTLEYMSPEQALAAPLGYKSDIYSLGSVLYALLTGKPPFTAKNLMEIVRKHQTGTLERIHNFRADVPDDLEAIIFDMLKIKAEERPANMYLLTKRFQSLLQALAGSPELISVKPFHLELTDAPPPSSGLGKAALNSDSSGSNKKSDSGQKAQSKITSLADSFGHQGEQNTAKPTLVQDNADLYAATDAFVLADGIVPKDRISKDDGLSLADDDKTEVRPQVLPAALTEQYVRPDSVLLPETPHKQELETYGLKTDGNQSFFNNSYLDNKPYIHKDETQEPEQPPVLHQESASRFVKVDDKEYESFDTDKEKRPLISLETVFASACLILIGFAIWYFQQSVPPDKLYKRITETLNINEAQLQQKQADDDSIEISAKALRSASEDITKFLEQYTNHPKAEQVRFLEDQLDLVNKERELERRLQISGTQKLIPIERDYLEAVATAKTNPDLTIVKLRALLDLYGYENPLADSGKSKERFLRSRLSRPHQCLEVARQRLKKLENDISSIREDQKHFLEQRLKDTRQLEKTAPERAEAIYKGLIELYKERPWADGLVKQAQSALKAMQGKRQDTVL